MKIPFRNLLITFATCLTIVHGSASAQAYPTRAVRIVVPFSPGGATDIVARLVADHLTRALGKPFVVENKGGASGIIGQDLVAKAQPDGYTLLMTGNGPHAINPSLFKALPYDPVQDFAPISLTALLPLVLNVHPSVQAGNVQEFVELVRRNPGKMSYASPGIGSPPQLTMELFKSLHGIDIQHVPYKGSAPALQDLIGGQVEAMFDNVLASYQHISSGRVRTLAVGTRERLEQLKEVPTFIESGVKDFEAYTWTALVAPAGTPQPIVERLAAEVRRMLESPEVRAALAAQGAIPRPSTPAELARFTKAEIDKWAKAIEAAGIEKQSN
jgi:tripartite-type tricarboxylate transporter receptor subunit TctC